MSSGPGGSHPRAPKRHRVTDDHGSEICLICGQTGHRSHDCSRGDSPGAKGSKQWDLYCLKHQCCYECLSNRHKVVNCPSRRQEVDRHPSDSPVRSYSHAYHEEDSEYGPGATEPSSGGKRPRSHQDSR